MKPSSSSQLKAEPDRAAVAALLSSAGMSGEFQLQPLAGGANNKVFRVDVGGRRALLKWYFSHPEDRRDRLSSEYSFCRFAWDRDIRGLPQPLACDATHRLGLYEFIEGRALSVAEVGQDHVDAAVDFFDALNRRRRAGDAAALPPASEACFSLGEHLECVDDRVASLLEMESGEDLQREALELVRSELSPVGQTVGRYVRSQAATWRLPIDERLDRHERCISPSDFGFHNAIVACDGRIVFIDFEYAGWDDPARAVCDFFCQVKLPVPATYFESVAASMLAPFPRSQWLRQRVDLLMPVYRLKWCCIVLNHFLPVGMARREFSGENNWQTVGRRQLKAARTMLSDLKATLP